MAAICARTRSDASARLTSLPIAASIFAVLEEADGSLIEQCAQCKAKDAVTPNVELTGAGTASG